MKSLRIGKVKESVLKRSVLKQLHNRNETVIPVRINPVEGWTLAPQRAVYGAVNAFAAAGADLHAIAVTILMPEGTQESQLKDFMKELNRVCEEQKVSIVAGHTAVSPAVHTLVVSVAAVGVENQTKDVSAKLMESGRKYSSEAMQSLNKTAIYANKDIIFIGNAGREGAAILAFLKEEELQSRYAASYIDTAKHLFDAAALKAAADIVRDGGALKLHDVREGGVFGGLWELAAACKVGLDIDLKSIPIRQHTIEVCEFYDLNPYMLLSGGCMLAICPDGSRAADILHQQGIEAAVIGRTTDGNDRIIRYDTEKRYLEPPKSDEIYKIKDIFHC